MELTVASAAGVTLPPGAAARMLAEISSRVAKKAPGRFAPGAAPADTLAADLTVTRYEEGNAFLRFLLAGLGAAHIDGVLRLQSGGETLGEYAVDKTFAWGGVYGGATEMEEIEQGFAEGVAALIVGEK